MAAKIVLCAGARVVRGAPAVSFTREQKALQEALAQTYEYHHKSLILSSPIHDASHDDLIAAMRDHRPVIVHLCGHGEGRHIRLLDSDGGTRPLTDETLGAILTRVPQRLHLLVLSACDSEAIARGLAERNLVDYAVGAPGTITDSAAEAFTRRFYEHLGGGMPVREAFELVALGTDDARLRDSLKLFQARDETVRFADLITPDSLLRKLKDFTRVDTKGLHRFSYGNVQDDFAGREEVVNELLGGFLAEPRKQPADFHFRYVVGGAGVGKSRLALEVIRKATEWPIAGFAERDAIDHVRPPDWTPSAATFLVIDYAPDTVNKLRELLASLARRSDGFNHPLRILLLGRAVDRDLMDGLVSKKSEGYTVGAHAPLGPIELKGLSRASCVGIMRRRITAVGGDADRVTDEALDKLLVSFDHERRPLWAAVVGELVGSDPSILGARSTVSPDDARRKALDDIIRRERAIWEERARRTFGRDHRKRLRQYEALLALATMTRGTSLQRVWAVRRHPALRLLPGQSAFTPDFYSVISDHAEKRDGEDWLAPLEPDLLGEGLIEFLYKDASGEEALVTALAWTLEPFGMALFASLFELDYGTAPRNPLRFLPATPPGDGLARVAVATALSSISGTRVYRLFDADPASRPDWVDPLDVSDRIENTRQGIQGFKQAAEQRAVRTAGPQAEPVPAPKALRDVFRSESDREDGENSATSR